MLGARQRAADALSTRLGRVYRITYWLNFLLAAGAVLVGLLAVFRWDSLEAKMRYVGLELGLVVYVLGLTVWARAVGWHARWLETRHLTELLRYGGLMALLGRPGYGPAEAVEGGAAPPAEPGDAWVAWYARATFRELGLPSARAEGEYLRAVADATLHGLIAGQIAYHEATHRRLLRVHRGLEHAGEALFVATAAVLAAFLVVAGAALVWSEGGLHGWVKHVAKPAVAFLGAGLPALGSALAGIRAQGDYEMRAHRSRATAAALRDVQRRLLDAMARDGGAHYEEVRRLLAEAATAMLSDLGVWRLVYRHRPIAIPS